MKNKHLTIKQARKTARAFVEMQRSFYGVGAQTPKAKDINIINFTVDKQSRWFETITFNLVGCERCKPTTLKMGYDSNKASLAFYFD